MAKLTFYGAAGTVTGSKYLVENGRGRVLVDCGLFQGKKEWRLRNWEDLPFDVRSLDAIVLTHAHIDHTGYLPRLVAQGYRGPVYCTRATAELLRVLLPDSARLQEEETDYRNRKGLTSHQPAKSLYTEQDAMQTLKLLHPIPALPNSGGEGMEVAPGMYATFYNAGHLLGARFVALNVTPASRRNPDSGGTPVLRESDSGGTPELREIQESGSTILFSGDVGRIARPILWDPLPPPACDYLLVESTYGDRLHQETDPMVDLARILKDAAARGSTVLIPAFAIGRAQELIYMIRDLEDRGQIPILPVRVDSPMSSLATQAFLRCAEEHDEEYKTRVTEHLQPLQTRNMRLVSSVAESKSLNEERGARVIIASSGMMTGGRVLHHALRVLPDTNAVIAFAGFQSEGTLGRRIQDGEAEVKIMKQWTPVRCKVEKIAGISGHADWKGLLEWLAQMEGQGPKVTYITHGEPASAEAMRGHIEERFGWRAEVAEYRKTVDLE